MRNRIPPLKTSARSSARTTREAPRTNGAPPESSDGSELELNPNDEAIADFVGSPPAVADHILVVATGPSGDAIVQDRTASECKRNPQLVAAQISIASERWAESERRVVRFRGTWMRGEKTCATHNWQCGTHDESGRVELDGSVTSFLIQLQLSAREDRKLSLENIEMIQEGWKVLLDAEKASNAELRRDNAELRDKLRKLDEVGSELAIENARADIEARHRQADLLEKRVLPIAQALIAKQLEQQQQPSASVQPVDRHSKDVDRDQK